LTRLAGLRSPVCNKACGVIPAAAQRQQ
jgi:hypothetical protein